MSQIFGALLQGFTKSNWGILLHFSLLRLHLILLAFYLFANSYFKFFFIFISSLLVYFFMIQQKVSNFSIAHRLKLFEVFKLPTSSNKRLFSQTAPYMRPAIARQFANWMIRNVVNKAQLNLFFAHSPEELLQKRSFHLTELSCAFDSLLLHRRFLLRPTE